MCRIKRLIISWSYVMYLNNFSKIATLFEFNLFTVFIRFSVHAWQWFLWCHRLILYIFYLFIQITYDFMLLQGMPDLRKNDPKKYLDSLHVSFQHLIEKNLACLLCGCHDWLLKRNGFWTLSFWRFPSYYFALTSPTSFPQRLGENVWSLFKIFILYQHILGDMIWCYSGLQI